MNFECNIFLYLIMIFHKYKSLHTLKYDAQVSHVLLNLLFLTNYAIFIYAIFL